MISITASDGTEVHAFEVKAAKETNNYLLVIHEWWGLNDYIKQEAERLQNQLGNVNVLALDMYDGKVATNAEEASKCMRGVVESRARTIIETAIAYAGTEARISTIGWCFGGGWSMQAALLAGNKAVGCVIYYGMPEMDQEKLKALAAPVLGIFAGKDGWVSPKVVDDFRTAMKSAGKSLTVKSYNAEHAFANPSNPKFDKSASADAHARALKFLKKSFTKK